MGDNSVIEIEIDIDKIDVDKIDVDNKIYERHNGKPITRVEISSNENYFITYSKEDISIVGWNVEDIDKVQLKFDQAVKINEDNKNNEDNKYEIKSLCVSDDKKLAYIVEDCYIIDMNNKDKKIVSSIDKYAAAKYCTFNLKGEFILYSVIKNYSTIGDHKIIWIYSTQTKNDKWE
ncbi:hypothetical protein RhiirA4_482689, partial [Rhizophagus irregularis]